MQATFTGFISGKSSQVAATGVHVGDSFSFSVQFDDATSSSSVVGVNGGELYTLISNTFTPAITAINGSLGKEIAEYNAPAPDGQISGWGGSQYWYRPVGVLHHRDWQLNSGAFSNQPQQRGYSIQLVTDFMGVGYGWFAIGSLVGDPISSSTLDYGFLTLTSFSISPVPEASTGVMLMGGLLLLAVVHRRRSNGLLSAAVGD